MNATDPPLSPVPVQAVRRQPGAPRGGGWVLAAWILVGLLALALAGLLLVALGPVAATVSALLALVPLLICLIGLRWVDRWDPEPLPWVAFALLWGAGIATLGSVLVEMLVGEGAQLSDEAQTVWVAPVVEESFKGLGVLVLLLVARRWFLGPVDGIVYGGLIGAGLAFSENILYLTDSMGDGSLGLTWLLRGLLSPFAHVLFTAWTGAAVGWASERRRSLILPAWLGGLCLAIVAHALWNGLASGWFFGNFLVGYGLLQVPFFAGAIVTCIVLVRRERRLCMQALRAYAAKGWYTQEEITALSTPALRRESKRWAARRGATAQMTSIIRTADALATVHQRIAARGLTPQLEAEQNELLHRSLTARESLRSAVAHGAGGWTAA